MVKGDATTKKVMPLIRKIVFKMKNGQKLTDEEILFNIKNSKIIVIISGIIWCSWSSISLGMSAFEFIKEISGIGNTIFYFCCIHF